MRPCDAVCFDFDGTLADSYEAITASVNYVRACHGLPFLAETEVRRHVGRGMPYLLEQTVPGFQLETDSARYKEHHPSVLRSGTRLLPGAAESVAALRAAGVRLGVTSNKPKPFTRELLDILGLTPCFAAVLGPEDVPRPKPAPDMLRSALTQLGVPPERALYVGDMVVDIETARGAGVAVWVVPTGSSDRATLEAARPERLLHDLHELAQFAKTWG